jgi:hypothetical protein
MLIDAMQTVLEWSIQRCLEYDLRIKVKTIGINLVDMRVKFMDEEGRWHVLDVNTNTLLY